MYKTLIVSTFAILYAEETDDIIELQINHIDTMRFILGDDECLSPEVKDFLNLFAHDMKLEHREEFKFLLEMCNEVESVMIDKQMSDEEKIAIAKDIVINKSINYGIYETHEEVVHDLKKANLFVNMALGKPIIKIEE